MPYKIYLGRCAKRIKNFEGSCRNTVHRLLLYVATLNVLLDVIKCKSFHNVIVRIFKENGNHKYMSLISTVIFVN